MLILALVLLQLVFNVLVQSFNTIVLTLGLVYLAGTLATRLLATGTPPLPAVGVQWLPTIGLDLLAFSVLQWTQPGNLNYTPLLGLPVLMAAALGSRLLTLSTAAAGTLMLLAQAWHLYPQAGVESAALFTQAGLTGTGYFLLGLLVHQQAQRLAREELASQTSRTAARVQAQVNALVIDNLTDGLLVLDAQEAVLALNPAARQLLGPQAAQLSEGTLLGYIDNWRPLLDLVRLTFDSGREQVADISLLLPDQTAMQLHTRTRLTDSRAPLAGNLCVVFLHDLREMEARLRTEKLAAMGRMSAAMAHEIRNPLAAIAQANALLEEDLQDPVHRRLVSMVQQNAQRLSRIVDDILDIARVEHRRQSEPGTVIELDRSVAQICAEWRTHPSGQRLVQLHLDAADTWVVFDTEHLRRILVNLLDNAQRYMSTQPDSLQVSTRGGPSCRASVQVWSDGQPMDPSVQRHLFEPFFSSESRSSGLGLYICRQLCERHGASISYQRSNAQTTRGPVQGNAFEVQFTEPRSPEPQGVLGFDTMGD
jgi:two-component system sensor histidine kinase PilS (NtrC family)